MCAQWSANAPCNEIISALEASRNKKGGVAGTINNDAKVSFIGWNFDEYISSIRSFISFKPNIPECEYEDLLTKSAFAAGKHGRISAKSLLAEINRQERDFLRMPLNNYVLITSLSLKYYEKLRTINVFNSRVKFYRILPRRFDRSCIAVKARDSLLANEPTTYTWVSVPVKARTVREATTNGLVLLELLRGIWNLAINRTQGFRISYGRTNPVNKIHVGPLHTLHLPDGSQATDMWWYEPGYIKPYPLYDLEKLWGKMSKYHRLMLNRIKQSPFKDTIINCIGRYTQALDEVKLHNAFLQLWSLLENLTGTQNANYGQTVKRASFFFQDQEHAQQILNHLRERRNLAIHQGKDIEDSETLVYQMKRYCEEILSFIILRSSEFANFEEYRQFIDLPANSDILRQQMKLRRRALKYRTGK